MKLIDPIDIKKQVKEGHLTFFVEKGRIYCKEPTCTVEVGKTDAIEVKQGEWIEHEYAEEFEGRLVSNFECSACHDWERKTSDFCPNCGADMRGGKE